MSQKFSTSKPPVEAMVRDIRRATRRHYSAEDKIRIVLEGLRGEQSIAELCRREGIAVSMYYSWSKEFLEAGKRRLAGDTVREATSGEVKALRQEAQVLKEKVAEQALELRLLKKSLTGAGAAKHEISRHGQARNHPAGRAIASAGAPEFAAARRPPPDILCLVRALQYGWARGTVGSPLAAQSGVEPDR